MGKDVQDISAQPDSADAFLEKQAVPFRKTSIRWVVLALACITNFGSYFCFDNPGALQTQIQDIFSIDSTTFGLLYSVYSLPNIVLPLAGGLIIDKLGVRVAIAVFAFFLILGQGIFTYGAYQDSFGIMIAGRVVFGLGGESLTVAQSSVTAKWFMGQELAFAMGITLCIARLGSSLNSVLSPKIYGWTGDLWAPLLLGFFLCIISWISGLLLNSFDKKADKLEGADAPGFETDKVSLKDFKNFKLIFYLLLFNCFFLYGGFFGIMDNVNDLIKSRFGFSNSDAGNLVTIVYICSAIITPIFGLVIDKRGKRVSMMIAASIVFILTHIYIAFCPDGTTSSPSYWIIIGLLGVGLFYSVYAAIFWPCVPLVVEPKVVGSAYGIITALQNLMLTIIPLGTGFIHDNTKSFHDGYFWTEIALALLVVVGLIITTWMYFVDAKTGSRLERPGSKKVDPDTAK